MNYVCAVRLVYVYQRLSVRHKVSVMVVGCAVTLILVVSAIGSFMAARPHPQIKISESQGE